MPITISYTAPKLRYYTVAGDTLKAIEAFMKRKGPVDPNEGKRMVAMTYTGQGIVPKWTHGRSDLHRAPNGEVTCSVKVKDMKFVARAVILLPKLGSNKLSPAARKEWDRFFRKLKAHELKHIAVYRGFMHTVLDEIGRLEGSALAKTEAAAEKAARADLELAIRLNYAGGKLDKRIRQMHHQFDKRTRHGQRSGAKLNTKIP
ncbi:hypothetical protein LNKW23_14930 [Paralimibaculum aggregatum]|uniref:DUF922 domain-containing protein n=1 Tax=Paralimibaculum aggregatum TaxID=3036245 RepID=A0ABQ6LJ71_9RHOB|nr:DUF922 domain-containing protein [Limibaculum sp. NKW23]GMG82280.1 hypothetical protein LNKW23_14930 [Limibaculum sp. NKW23]